MFSCCSSSGCTSAGPGPLEIVAAADAVDVQGFSRKENTRVLYRFQRIRKLVERDAARTHLGFPKSVWPVICKRYDLMAPAISSGIFFFPIRTGMSFSGRRPIRSSFGALYGQISCRLTNSAVSSDSVSSGKKSTRSSARFSACRRAQRTGKSGIPGCRRHRSR